MLDRIAHWVLRLRILKKASRLPMTAKLGYLMLSYRVHGAMIPFTAIGFLATAFVATCCIYPHFAVMIHLDKPEDEAVSDVWTFILFASLAFFCLVEFVVLFSTRKMLAEFWLTHFLATYRRVQILPCRHKF